MHDRDPEHKLRTSLGLPFEIEGRLLTCCQGDHPATRRVYPFLDIEDGVYDVCDDDAHLPIPALEIEEIERFR